MIFLNPCEVVVQIKQKFGQNLFTIFKILLFSVTEKFVHGVRSSMIN